MATIVKPDYRSPSNSAATSDLIDRDSARRSLNIASLNDATAGIMMVPFGQTEDGFERQLGTNHLGHAPTTDRSGTYGI